MLHRPFSFAITFLALFALVFAFMWYVDALPNSVTGGDRVAEEHTNTPVSSDTSPATPTAPVRVIAKSIGLDAAVVNPATTDVELLDKALEDGAVRYPTSAMLNTEGTVLIFGHSSYLPVVYHQYYKTFNGIQNLKKGAVVSVYSTDREFRYSVTDVHLANADEDVIELPTNGQHLVLVTCDSFSKKSTRYVVHADFIGAYSL